MSISLPTWTRREFPLLGRRYRVRAVIATSLRREMRKGAAVVVVAMGMIFTIVPSLLIVLVTGLFSPGQRLGLTFFPTPATSIAILFFATLIAAVVGAGLIADDVDTMALTMYLSRPLTVSDYLIAKAAILAALTALVAILPIVLTPFLGALLGLFEWPVAVEAVAISLLLGVLFTAFMTSLSLFLSSLTRRRAYAAAALFAIIFGLFGTAQILAAAVNNNALRYLSPWDDYSAVAYAAFGATGLPTAVPIDWAPALAILLGVTVIMALATWLRMRSMEVVST